jgi:putative membrane protein
MEYFLFKLVNTFVFLRPYVLVFFLVYLLGCSLHLGLKRALIFSIVGYLIAWLSEFSSIHNGIPYGHYYYIEHTVDEELWVLGVPLMDSMSYVFLAYASYCMALMVISPAVFSGRAIYVLETREKRNSLSARVLGSLFFVYLDIVIDPVALRGEKWFLGRIYEYPEEGAYFGVPISNFAGWFVVGFTLMYSLQKIDAYLHSRGSKDFFGYGHAWRYLMGPALYLGVLVFNLSVAFYIGEYALGWAGTFIIVLPAALLYFMKRERPDVADRDKAVREHLEDFPEASVPGTS